MTDEGSAPEPCFDEYCAQVWHENAHMATRRSARPEARSARTWCAVTLVCLTAYAQRQWDAPARANLRREFDRLR